MREQLAEKYIRGRGIEIGGLHYPTKVPAGCLVTYVDRNLEDVAATHADVMPVGYTALEDDAEVMANFSDGSQDFLIANHVLEHCHDPIGTLRRWLSLLRAGGIVYCALPEKNHTFDHPRQITTLEHLVHDHEMKGMSALDRDHYRDWFHTIDKMQGEQLDQRVELAYSKRENIHFHVWDLAAMKELMNHPLISELGAVVEGAVHGAEVIWILRRK